jgi:hypothetical protein
MTRRRKNNNSKNQLIVDLKSNSIDNISNGKISSYGYNDQYKKSTDQV